jgi:hypothetical protein
MKNSRKNDMIQPIFQVSPGSAYKGSRVFWGKSTHDNGGINHCHSPAGFIGVQFLKVFDEIF